MGHFTANGTLLDSDNCVSPSQIKSFQRRYEDIDNEFSCRTDTSYDNLVNFSSIGDLPYHSWYNYKEGYSPDLVRKILGRIGATSSGLKLLDPFSGSGTTMIVGKEKGFHGTGFEINPFAALLSRVKTRNYSENEIKAIESFRIRDLPQESDAYENYDLKIIRNLFDEGTISSIELIKNNIKTVSNERVRDLLLAAFLTIIDDVSRYRKGGNGLKRKTHYRSRETVALFMERIRRMSADLHNPVKGDEPLIIGDSCLNMEKYDIDNIDLSFFSPPYANCFDPFEIYKTELWIGNFVSSYDEMRRMRKRALRSNLNTDLGRGQERQWSSELLDDILEHISNQELWSRKITDMLRGYFDDMHILLSMIFERTKKNGYSVIVVGNSSYGNLAVPTDILISQIGRSIGFGVREMIVARRNETSSQQHKKLGSLIEYMRESIIVLQK